MADGDERIVALRRSSFDTSIIMDSPHASAQDLLFREARTHVAWQDKPVPASLLRDIYDLARLGPTSNNCNPMRIVFVMSRDAKERMRPALRPANVEKAMAAPITAIVAYDLRFFDQLPHLFPRDPGRAKPYAADADHARMTALRNGTLQGAYLILAARLLGLDCGPMSGFDHDLIDAAFFPDGAVRSNFLLNIGYGAAQALHPRLPRLAFDEACAMA